MLSADEVCWNGQKAVASSWKDSVHSEGLNGSRRAGKQGTHTQSERMLWAVDLSNLAHLSQKHATQQRHCSHDLRLLRGQAQCFVQLGLGDGAALNHGCRDGRGPLLICRQQNMEDEQAVTAKLITPSQKIGFILGAMCNAQAVL